MARKASSPRVARWYRLQSPHREANASDHTLRHIQKIEETDYGEIANDDAACRHCVRMGYICRRYNLATQIEWGVEATCSRCRAEGVECESQIVQKATKKVKSKKRVSWGESVEEEERTRRKRNTKHRANVQSRHRTTTSETAVDNTNNDSRICPESPDLASLAAELKHHERNVTDAALWTRHQLLILNKLELCETRASKRNAKMKRKISALRMEVKQLKEEMRHQ